MTDLLVDLPPPESEAAASPPEWTAAHAAASRARLQRMVREVLARMPKPPQVVLPPPPGTDWFEETDAFRRAVAALIEG